MGRRYAARGKKKRKLEDGAASRADDAEELPPPEDDEAKGGEDATDGDETVEVAEGIPVLPRPVDAKKRPRAIFMLERACLEVGKVGKTMQILNSDDHANYLRKQNRNPADYRPDIIYQALMEIFDSPLTKAGRLQAVYVRTGNGVLFEVKPNVRLPHTPKRFCGLMSQLLQKLSITAVGNREKLLNVIKNPVTQYLPVGSRKIGLSYSVDKSVKLNDYVAECSDDEALVFVVGAMAHGKIDNAYIDDYIRTPRSVLPAVYIKYAPLWSRNGTSSEEILETSYEIVEHPVRKYALLWLAEIVLVSFPFLLGILFVERLQALAVKVLTWNASSAYVSIHDDRVAYDSWH